MDFAKIIKSLLIANDRLCIPGLGTFVTRYKPAEIVPGMNYIKPPSKLVSFDPSLKKDETGIMASFIAKQERISIQDAYEKVKVFVDNILERLNNDRDFGVPGIGSFSLKDRKVQFLPEVTGNLRAESYGLSDVSTSGEVIVKKTEWDQRAVQPASSADKSIKAEEKKKAVDIKKAKPSTKPEVPADKSSDNPQSADGKWILVGIAVPVIALLICVFLIFPNNDFFEALFSSQEVTVTTESDTSFQTEVTDVEKYIDTTANQTEALKFEDEEIAVPEPKVAVKVEPKPVMDDKYAHCKDFYIIAGSYKNMSLARRQRNILRNQGYEAEILVKGDTNRVYIKKFSNRQEALKDLEQLQASGMSVWLLSQ